MTPETVEAPPQKPEIPNSSIAEQEKPVGLANSFSDSQRRRNRIASTNPTESGDTPAAPTPLPKRPKGRFFVGSFLVTLVFAFLYAIWSAFFSVVAHGVVEGRKLNITPLETSVIRTIHVRDGEFVQQGDPLFTLEKANAPEVDENKLENELNAAIHDFKVEIAKQRVNASLSNNQKAKARAEYLHWLGELLQEQSVLEDLIDKQRRHQLLAEKNSTGVANLKSIEFKLKGQRAKVTQLTLAVEQLEKNASSIETDVDFTDLIDAHQARIRDLQIKLRNKQTESNEIVVTAPVTGKIIRIERFTGERVEPGESLMELVESGSVRPVLYMVQNRAAQYEPGQTIQIELKPNRGLLNCTVERIGDEFHDVPKNLKGKITQDAQVVSVYLRPDDPDIANESMRLGSLIELPHPFSFSSCWRKSTDEIERGEDDQSEKAD